MMKKIMFVAAALVAALGTGRAEAQLPLAVEGHVGAALPVGEFADNAKTAPAYGASVSLDVAPGVAVYGGWSRADYDLKQPTAEAKDTGFEIGARIGLPVPFASPFVKAGVLLHDFEIKQQGVENEGEDEVGFEVGVGADLGLAPRVSLVPAVTYRRFATEFFNQGDRNITSVNLALGLRVHF